LSLNLLQVMAIQRKHPVRCPIPRLTVSRIRGECSKGQLTLVFTG
jgi:hypothetical protein